MMRILMTLFVLMSLASCDEDSGTSGEGGEGSGSFGMTGGDGDDCEYAIDEATGNVVLCMGEDSSEEIPCPDGFTCGGLSAFECYKGTECELPQCLDATVRIATPRGEVGILELRVGDSVWTRTVDGRRVAAPVKILGSTRAPANHRMVRFVLADGRRLRASPGHPTAGGGTLLDLSAGATYDGARIVSANLEPYESPRTYDLLPAGDTGHYWANGVLLGSTLGGANCGVTAP